MHCQNLLQRTWLSGHNVPKWPAIVASSHCVYCRRKSWRFPAVWPSTKPNNHAFILTNWVNIITSSLLNAYTIILRKTKEFIIMIFIINNSGSHSYFLNVEDCLTYVHHTCVFCFQENIHSILFFFSAIFVCTQICDLEN